MADPVRWAMQPRTPTIRERLQLHAIHTGLIQRQRSAVAGIDVQKVLEQGQVAGTGDGQKLGQALNDSQDYRFDQTHTVTGKQNPPPVVAGDIALSIWAIIV